MKKVIVRLGNGLGNQLFTYAAAYSFAKQNNANLFIDDESGFYKRYKYELHNFNISAPIADKEYKFTNVYGKIKFVNYGEDYKVKFVKYSEDLSIKYVRYGEDEVGRWKVVDYGEDYKIKVVKYGEDFKAREVDYGEGCN